VENPKVRHPEWQLPVGAGPVVENEAMTRAVHRLQAKRLLLNVQPDGSRQHVHHSWADCSLYDFLRVRNESVFVFLLQYLILLAKTKML